MSAVRGRCPLMLRTGWSVVRRTVRVSPSGSSIGERRFGHVHGHRVLGELPSECDLLPGHHDHAGVRRATLRA